MTNSIRTIGALILIILILYGLGIIKLPKNWSEVQNGDITLLNPCFRKNVNGNYKLALSFEKSRNKTYEKLKLEILYDFNLSKNRCEIYGTGKKEGFSTTDSTTKKRGSLKKDIKDIKLTGYIKEDTLFISITFNTASNNDFRVDTSFPFPSDNITVLYGKFKEYSASSEGSAKLTRKIVD